jgi:hypothetical protein
MQQMPIAMQFGRRGSQLWKKNVQLIRVLLLLVTACHLFAVFAMRKTTMLC